MTGNPPATILAAAGFLSVLLLAVATRTSAPTKYCRSWRIVHIADLCPRRIFSPCSPCIRQAARRADLKLELRWRFEEYWSVPDFCSVSSAIRQASHGRLLIGSVISNWLLVYRSFSG